MNSLKTIKEIIILYEIYCGKNQNKHGFLILSLIINQRYYYGHNINIYTIFRIVYGHTDDIMKTQYVYYYITHNIVLA